MIEEDPMVKKEPGFSVNVQLQLSNDMEVAERKRYSWWQLLGDIGGFHDGLVLLIKFFMASYSAAMF